MTGADGLGPGVEERLRASFARQQMMATIGARLAELGPGCAAVELAISAAVGQQHGFVHGGATAAIADTACGYAVLSQLPAGSGVLTVELKVNFLAPAGGELLVASAHVKRAGRTLSLAVCDVEAIAGAERNLVAHMTATMMAIEGRADVVD